MLAYACSAHSIHFNHAARTHIADQRIAIRQALGADRPHKPLLRPVTPHFALLAIKLHYDAFGIARQQHMAIG